METTTWSPPCCGVGELLEDETRGTGSMDHGYVLVVDDDPGIHNLLGLILCRLSLDVKYAFNGYEALDMVATHRPSLLLLDLDMPGLDGFDVLTHLSQNTETADIPVMIYSAHAYDAQRQGYEWPLQVVNVFEKSQVRPAELRDSVREQLNSKTRQL